jgi:hypothetical protein
VLTRIYGRGILYIETNNTYMEENKMITIEIEEELTLDELLDSKEFKKEVNTLNHIPQMMKQRTLNTLADTGRYPELN